MQYVFFNNDSRFYKINVNLLNLLKDISTQGTSVILCAWWLGLTLRMFYRHGLSLLYKLKYNVFHLIICKLLDTHYKHLRLKVLTFQLL